MAHQGDASALRGTVEEGDLDISVLQGLGIVKRSFPRCIRVNSFLVIVSDCKLGTSIAVDFYHVLIRSDK